MKSERNIGVDIARTIAMASIVLGHLGIGNINRVVFTYHVTIFYLIAGYYMSGNKTFGEFLKRKLQTLIVPYYLSCIAVTIAALLLNFFTGHSSQSVEIVKHWTSAALYGAGDSYTTPFVINQIGAIWFLWAMFWASLILWALLKVKTLIRIIFVFTIFAFLTWTRRLFWFPLSIQSAGAALLFMYLGYLYKKIEYNISALSKEVKVMGTIVLLWLWVSFIRDFQSFWLVHGDYGRGIVDIIGSLAGCTIILMVCGWIAKSPNSITRFLAYFGPFTIMILFFHIIELDTGMLNIILGNQIDPASEQYLFILVALKFVWAFGGTFLLSKTKTGRRVFGIRY